MTAGFGGHGAIARLSAAETRVLGCMLEKQRTTPDAYPLSLNALRLACNQSTNRDPVVDYDEATIRDALYRLERQGLVRLAGASRAAKYRHLLAEALPMDDPEQAAMCVLMLRGAQTPGELKQRGERIHAFGDLVEVRDTLERLIERGLVQRLARRPGHKEERYAHLLAEDSDVHDAGREPAAAALSHAPASAEPTNGAGAGEQPTGEARPSSEDADVRALQELSERVARLERELALLRANAGSADSLHAP
jgi:uncharacterized protein YceH (UPF0502 family)